jgi:MoaA/NifB/PqqE/SkfB family radical SAM enzyme
MNPKIIYNRTEDYSDIAPLYGDSNHWLKQQNIDINLCDYWDYVTGIAHDVITGKREGIRPRLRRLSVFITDRCNLNCRHCKVDRKENRTIDQGWLLENMQTARKMGAQFLDIMGLGEPTLVDYLPDLTQIAAKLGFVVTVGTNGMTYNLETNEYLTKLLNTSPVKFRVSMDSADPVKHNFQRSKDEAWQKSLSFIKTVVKKRELKQIQTGIFVNYLVKSSNLKEIPESLIFFAELGIDDVHLIPIRFFEKEYCTPKQIQMYNQEIAPKIEEIGKKYKLAWARKNAFVFGNTEEEITLASRGIYYRPLQTKDCYLLKSQLLFDSCLRPFTCLWGKRNGGRSMEKEIGQETNVEKVWAKLDHICYPEINPCICQKLCTREVFFVNNKIENLLKLQ